MKNIFKLKIKDEINVFILFTKDSYVPSSKESREKEFLAKPQYTKRDYKVFQKNFGFGKDFLPFEAETKEEKLEKNKLRNEYSEHVRMKNFEMLEEKRKTHTKKNFLNINSYSKTNNYVRNTRAPKPETKTESKVE